MTIKNLWLEGRRALSVSRETKPQNQLLLNRKTNLKVDIENQLRKRELQVLDLSDHITLQKVTILKDHFFNSY
jgi:hypothetical protein